jgi:membrane protein DedA with SNARE-associated domain
MLFAVLMACGVGLPLPEDVSLVTGGYLSSLGVVDFLPMLVVAFAGILAGDFLIFSAGRRYGSGLVTSRWISRIISEEKRCRVEGYFARYGERLVFAARFVPGFRAVTYFVAGASPMETWKFLAFDGIAACVSVPVWMGLGRKFGRHLPHWTQWAVLGVAVAAIGFVALTALRRRREDDLKTTFDPATTPDQAVGGSS